MYTSAPPRLIPQVDMVWEGSDLAADQDKPRQKLCDFIDANGHRWGGEGGRRGVAWRVHDGLRTVVVRGGRGLLKERAHLQQDVHAAGGSTLWACRGGAASALRPLLHHAATSSQHPPPL